MSGREIWAAAKSQEGRDEILDEDQQWVEQVRRGQTEAFSVLVKKYQRGLLRLSLRFVKNLATAEDVVQESFLKAFERIESFEGRSSFRSWLFQITVNTARNKLRDKRDSHGDIDQMQDQIQLAVAPTAEQGLHHEALARLVAKYVETLPFRQKTALILRVYEDLSFKEIAEVMCCPYDTAKANYRHALLKLKDEFSKNADLQTWNFEEPNFGDLSRRIPEVEI